MGARFSPRDRLPRHLQRIRFRLDTGEELTGFFTASGKEYGDGDCFRSNTAASARGFGPSAVEWWWEEVEGEA